MPSRTSQWRERIRHTVTHELVVTLSFLSARVSHCDVSFSWLVHGSLISNALNESPISISLSDSFNVITDIGTRISRTTALERKTAAHIFLLISSSGCHSFMCCLTADRRAETGDFLHYMECKHANSFLFFNTRVYIPDNEGVPSKGTTMVAKSSTHSRLTPSIHPYTKSRVSLFFIISDFVWDVLTVALKAVWSGVATYPFTSTYKKHIQNGPKRKKQSRPFCMCFYCGWVRDVAHRSFVPLSISSLKRHSIGHVSFFSMLAQLRVFLMKRIPEAPVERMSATPSSLLSLS